VLLGWVLLAIGGGGAGKYVRYFHKTTNGVHSLAGWHAAAGLRDEETEEGAQQPIVNPLSEAFVLLSTWLHQNSTMRSTAGPVLSELLAYVERPGVYATRAFVSDGDGLCLVYEAIPPELCSPDDHAVDHANNEGLAPTATQTQQQQEPSGGYVINTGTRLMSTRPPPAGGQRSFRLPTANDPRLVLPVRLVCIDAPEWNQPWLVGKKLLTIMLEEMKCNVRLSRVYYSEGDGDSLRVFAEVMVAPPPPATPPPASFGAGPTNEAMLHVLLLAAGSVYLMPQYLFSKSVDELHTSIAVVKEARDRTRSRNIGTPCDDPTSYVDHHVDIVHFLTEKWKTMHSSQVHRTCLLSFFTRLAAKPIVAADEYADALGEDWYKEGFNLHLFDEGKPLEIPPGDVLGPLGWGPMASDDCEESAKEGHRWWKKSDVDVDYFHNEMDMFVWGRPHLVKARSAGAHATG
jgi:hypothetical protein